jgi:hypothetical protein
MFALQNKRQLLWAAYTSAVIPQTKVALVNIFWTAQSLILLVQRGETAERGRLLTGTSRSLSKGVKPEGEDVRSNGDVAADKFLSILPCVKNFTTALNWSSPRTTQTNHTFTSLNIFLILSSYLQLVFLSNLFHYTCGLKFCTLKLEEVGSSEMSIPTYQTIRCLPRISKS